MSQMNLVIVRNASKEMYRIDHYIIILVLFLSFSPFIWLTGLFRIELDLPTHLQFLTKEDFFKNSRSSLFEC